MIGISSIRSGLRSLLQQLVDSSSASVVYDYYEPAPSGYPAIVFDISSNEDAFLTTSENLLKMTVTAYVIVEIYENGIEESTAILDSISDSVIALISDPANMDLSGSADWMSPAIGPRSQIATPKGQALSQQLDIVINASRAV